MNKNNQLYAHPIAIAMRTGSGTDSVLQPQIYFDG